MPHEPAPLQPRARSIGFCSSLRSTPVPPAFPYLALEKSSQPKDRRTFSPAKTLVNRAVRETVVRAVGWPENSLLAGSREDGQDCLASTRGSAQDGAANTRQPVSSPSRHLNQRQSPEPALGLMRSNFPR